MKCIPGERVSVLFLLLVEKDVSQKVALPNAL